MADSVIKNKYRLIRRIGRGGMGSVYEVEHQLLGVRRALKQLSTDLQSNTDLQRRFLVEAQTMARLDHPNIVRVYDVDFEPDFGAYILMELIRGDDLGKYVAQRGRLTYDETIHIGIAVGSALACAHRNQVVHRDIKPANILIEDGSSRPVVTDFGIAKRLESVEDSTMTRGFLGTVRYSSREQIRNDKVTPIDARADIYSLGVVLYELCTGQKFLQGVSEGEIIALVGFRDGWRPELSFAEPPGAFGDAIRECLEPDRDARIGSAAELVQRLERCRSPIPVPLRPTDDGSSAMTSPIVEMAATSPSLEMTMPSLAERSTRNVLSRAQPTEAKARWLALLQTLRTSVDEQAASFERLLQQLIAAELPRDKFRQLDDMSQILHRVEQAEGAGNYQEAAAGLQGISDRMQRLSEQMHSALAEGSMRSLQEIAEGWRALSDEAADLMGPEDGLQLSAALTAAESTIAEAAWDACQDALRTARNRLEQVRQSVRERATQRIAEDLREIDAIASTVRSRGLVVPSALQLEPLERATQDALAQQRPARAAALADAALAEARAALHRLDVEEQHRADAARSAAEEARAALPEDEAREFAGESLASAEAALGAGVAALQRGAWGEAEGQFERARALVARTADDIARGWSDRASAARTTLTSSIALARAAPDAVVGTARATAEQLLSQDTPVDPRPFVARLKEANGALARALAEVEDFRTAQRRAQEAHSAYDRVHSVAVDRIDLSDVATMIGEADGALERAAYRAAAEGFAAASARLDEAERELLRSDEEALAALRTESARVIAELDFAIAADLCAAPLARAREASTLADDAALRGDPLRAIGTLRAVVPELRAARSSCLEALREEAIRLDGELRTLLDDAMELLPVPLHSGLSSRSAGVARSLGERPLRESAAELANVRAALEAARATAFTTARDTIARGLSEARELAEVIAALASGEDRTAGTAAHANLLQLSGACEELLARGRPGAAARRVDQGVDQLRRTRDLEHTRRQQRLASVKDAAERTRRAIPAPSAQALAREELARADELLDSARRAEAANAPGEAIRLYAEANAGHHAVQALVVERATALLETERVAMAALVATAEAAPREIVGEVRLQCSKLLARQGADPWGLANELRSARSRLEAALEEGAQVGRASTCRETARAAEQRAAALRPGRRQLKGPTVQLRDAEAAFARRSWLLAEQGFEGAARAFDDVSNELQRARDQDQAAAREKAQVRARAEEVTRSAEAVQAKRRPVADELRLRGENRSADQARRAGASIATDCTVAAEDIEDATVLARGEAGTTATGISASRLAIGAAAVATAGAIALWLSLREPKTASTSIPADPLPASVRRASVHTARDGEAVAPRPTMVDIAGAATVPQEGPTAKRSPAQTAMEQMAMTEGNVPRGPDTEGTGVAKDGVLAPSNQPREVVVDGAKPSTDDGGTIALAPIPGAQPRAVPAPEPGARSKDVEVASVAPLPAPPPPLVLSGFTPELERMSVPEGTKQPFAFRVAGGDRDGKRTSVWRLGDRVVARDVDRWSYAPGYDDAAATARELSVEVKSGAQVQRHRWEVLVENVNRAPTIKPGRKIEAATGETIELKAEAKDPDGDRLSYSWSLDGKPTGDDSPRLQVPVTGDQKVALAASDGTASATASWQIAAIRPAESSVAPSPPSQQEARDIESLVRDWLRQYEAALNAKDAAAVGRLRSLSADEIARVRQALIALPDLVVTLSGVRVERVGENRARVSYSRLDRFTRPDNKMADSKETEVSQQFELDDGTLRERR